MDDLITIWVLNVVGDLGRYVLVAVPAFWVFWIWKRERFRDRLIQGAFADASHARRELRYSALTIIVFSLVGTLLVLGTTAGVVKIYTSVSDHGWCYFAFTFIALPVLHDTYFYWTHRAMHHRWLYRHVHRVHHLSTNPSPLAAYAFAPAEALVQAAFVPLVVLVIPVHAVALFTFLAFMIVRNVLGHLGIELLPPRFIRWRWLNWNTTSTHHSMHHRHVRTNYALYFTWWDRAMNTLDARYVATFATITSRRR
jgi:Delta7-sterol 5-desaturase